MVTGAPSADWLKFSKISGSTVKDVRFTPKALLAGARLGLARFAADLATLRGLPRLTEFPLRSLARFFTFDRRSSVGRRSAWLSQNLRAIDRCGPTVADVVS